MVVIIVGYQYYVMMVRHKNRAVVRHPVIPTDLKEVKNGRRPEHALGLEPGTAEGRVLPQS